jgi:hypothetical protein
MKVRYGSRFGRKFLKNIFRIGFYFGYAYALRQDFEEVPRTTEINEAWRDAFERFEEDV